MKKWILAGFVMVGLIGAWFGYRMYHKPHVDVESAKPFGSYSAAALNDALDTASTTTQEMWIGKILQVSGVIASVQFPQENQATLLLEIPGHPESNIKIGMDPQFKQSWADLATGSEISIRAIYSGIDEIEGISRDIELSRGVVIEK